MLLALSLTAALHVAAPATAPALPDSVESFGFVVKRSLGSRLIGWQTLVLRRGENGHYELVDIFDTSSDAFVRPPRLFPVPAERVASLREALYEANAFEAEDQPRMDRSHCSSTWFNLWDGEQRGAVFFRCIHERPSPGFTDIMDLIVEVGANDDIVPSPPPRR